MQVFRPRRWIDYEVVSLSSPSADFFCRVLRVCDCQLQPRRWIDPEVGNSNPLSADFFLQSFRRIDPEVGSLIPPTTDFILSSFCGSPQAAIQGDQAICGTDPEVASSNLPSTAFLSYFLRLRTILRCDFESAMKREKAG